MEVVKAVESRADEAAPHTADDFALWVEPWVAAMTRLAARLGTGMDRDDVVQEALVRAWRKRHQFDPKRGSASAWLLAITADQARQASRRRRRGGAVRDLSATLPQPDEALDVELAILKLSPRQRLAVDAYYFAGLSISDTAAVMKCSEGTVKSTLSDARRNLRQHLEEPEHG